MEGQKKEKEEEKEEEKEGNMKKELEGKERKLGRRDVDNYKYGKIE